MSNQIAKIKENMNQKNKQEEFKKKMCNMNNKGITINFNERVLPRTILVDVWGECVYIGNETDPIGSCEKIIPGRTKSECIEFINKIKAVGPIDKVIINNTGNPKNPEDKPRFGIIKLEEFINDLQTHIDKMP